MILRRLRETFNLNIPMGRLRYFFSYIILILISAPFFIVLAPNIILYEGNETLFNAFQNGIFEKTEIIFYILISILLGYAIQFFLDSKRIYSIIDNKMTSVIIAIVMAIVSITAEFFVPFYNYNALNTAYLILCLLVFGFLCLKKGAHNKAETKVANCVETVEKSQETKEAEDTQFSE